MLALTFSASGKFLSVFYFVKVQNTTHIIQNAGVTGWQWMVQRKQLNQLCS